MALGLSLIAGAPPPAIAISATALLGFGFSFPWSAIASTALRRVPNGERGSAVGVLTAFCDLFVGISSFGAGAIANRLGYPAAFIMAIGAIAAAAISGRFMFADSSRPSSEAADLDDEPAEEAA